MIREDTSVKRFRSLILAAFILVLLAGFMTLNSEKVLAGSYVFFQFSKDNNTTLTVGGEEEWLWLHSGCTSYANPLSWKSSDETIATISANNERKVCIHPKKPGTTTISVQNIEGTKTATCEVTVVGRFEFSDPELTLPIDQGSYTLNLINDYIPDDYDE